MYLCECGKLFEEPCELKEDTGEIFAVCPSCRETSFEEVKECELCGEYFEQFNYNKICDDCAEDEYTTRLGLKFIDKYKVEFFIGYLYGIEKYDRDKEEELLKVLESEFYSNLIFNNDNILDEEKEEQIKEFSLSDWVNWVDFLQEEIL